MSARDWQPGEEALVRVRVTWTDDSGTVECSIGGESGYYLDTADLLPVPQADEGAIRALWVETLLPHVCQCREAFGHLAKCHVAVRDLYNELRAAGLLASPVQPGRSEAEIKAEMTELAGPEPDDTYNPYTYDPWDDDSVDPSNLDDVVQAAVSVGWDAGAESVRAEIRGRLAARVATTKENADEH